MNERPTPETEEATERWHQGKINIFDEMSRIERERDEAREQVENQKTRIGEFFSALEKLTAERDEARQDAKHWEELYRTISTY